MARRGFELRAERRSFAVEQLIPKPGIEAFAVSVLSERLRRAVGPLGPDGSDPDGPRSQRVRDFPCVILLRVLRWDASLDLEDAVLGERQGHRIVIRKVLPLRSVLKQLI